ncbi:hypothetical protein KRE47_01005 [Elizabethkingia meningoseptica]|uniref:DUF6705 family protein n=1 Tax=Elizabethkingia meningoseptica TaxID=238 RepID=UPI000841F7E3|nr:hypothetical protein [Elizabethkingia meningoseptica]MDE5429585.1 hypothetical protein [Elizabethkingia meningoseptica]MDE5467245.1 hypothetical protein [Elizabethkingia meningoseptica]MDE5473525.1 hypothetical protein [Elizabethkingia meningoseptica]MDE5476958.1 hypothetical protein [Elizabethkingia meningoseptica]MDE5484564.1 hypothetical protein [Elizabethkingia meningoseptica]
MKTIKVLLILIFLVITQTIFAQSDTKRPEDIFELYFKIFVKNDEAALRELNDYMRPLAKGRDMFTIDFKKKTSEVTPYLTNVFLNFFSYTAGKSNKQLAEDYSKMIQNSIANTTYKIKSSNLMNNENQKDKKIVEISYQVVFNVPEKSLGEALTPFQNKLKSLNSDEVKALILELKNLQANTKEYTLDKKIELYGIVKDEKIYYYMPNPSLIIPIDSFLGLYYGNFN